MSPTIERIRTELAERIEQLAPLAHEAEQLNEQLDELLSRLNDPTLCAWCHAAPRGQWCNLCESCDMIGWVQLPDGSLIEECELSNFPRRTRWIAPDGHAIEHDHYQETTR